MKKFAVTVNGKNYDVEIEQVEGVNQSKAEEKVEIAVQKTIVVPIAPQSATTPKIVDFGEGESIKAPLPGKIIKVQKGVGDAVKAGDLLIILEAMKMENEITAPKDGIIAAIQIADGATVGSGDVMMVIA